MPNDIAKAQDLFLDRISHMCDKLGLNNIMAQVYSILYLSAKPMSLDDMVERLKISKGSASINIRALERYGVVRQIWIKGSRKDYYEAEPDIAKVIIGRIQSMVSGRLSEVDETIRSAMGALDGMKPENAEEAESIRIFKDRVEKVSALYGQAKSLFELFDTALLSKDFAAKVGHK